MSAFNKVVQILKISSAQNKTLCTNPAARAYFCEVFSRGGGVGGLM